MAKILKQVAIAAGAGLAVGLTAMSPARPASPLRRPASLRDDEILDLEPVLDRLEALERRLERMDQQAAPEPAVHLEQFVELRIASLRAEIPVLVATGIDARIAALEARIEAELEAQRRQTFEALGPMIEAGVARHVDARFETLEKAVAEQSSSIAALRERVEQTDLNLQRLVVAIERLVEGTAVQHQRQMPRSPVAPAPANASFQAHLNEHLETQSQTEDPPQPPFRSRIFVEPEAKEERKPRFPLSRIFGALLAFSLTRLFR
jgi:uncharacterized coiled-coil protein SlyX